MRRFGFRVLLGSKDQSSPNRFASASASNFDSTLATTFRHPGRISWPTAHEWDGCAGVAQTT